MLQRELTKHSDVFVIRQSPHQENESLYWSKAAAILDLPQPEMIDSGILPMDRTTALSAMHRLLEDNLPTTGPPPADRQQLFATWRELTQEYGPVFLEKSPHHLHNRAVLELLLQAQDDMPEIQFRFIGLVRNPVDTLYSMWNRWKTVPEERESEWCRAYGNLLWLKKEAPEATHIVRYEDLTAAAGILGDLCTFIGVSLEPGMGDTLHRGSLQAWRSDPTFGYVPGDRVRRIAADFGYDEDDLATTPSRRWPLRREVGRRARQARSRAGSTRRRLSRKPRR